MADSADSSHVKPSLLWDWVSARSIIRGLSSPSPTVAACVSIPHRQMRSGATCSPGLTQESAKSAIKVAILSKDGALAASGYAASSLDVILATFRPDEDRSVQ